MYYAYSGIHKSMVSYDVNGIALLEAFMVSCKEVFL